MFQQKIIRGAHEGPNALVIGGVHGDEYEPMLAIFRLMQTLDAQQLSGTITFVAVVNEDAFARRNRTASDDLDLARTCPGDLSGSHTHRLAHQISALIRDANFLVDLHTGGVALQVAPLVGYALHEDETILNTQREMARAFNLPIIWGSSPGLDGRTLSVARDAKVPAIYAEWGGGAPLNPTGVADYVEGTLGVLALWKMIERELPVSRVAHVVEDARAGSGDLLAQHPAPFAGFVEMRRLIGEKVQAGEPLANLWTLDGARCEEIRAERDGLLILTRSLPPVQTGDSIAMILEIQ